MVEQLRMRWMGVGVAMLAGVLACGAQSAKPVITKIDPPNWFTQLPDAMLLVHGENFENTTFALRKTKARISETKISGNGHWAFLTLATGTAKPGVVEVEAKNAKGTTVASYALMARRKTAEQPRGFDGRDVMYLIMPDRFADGDTSNDAVAGYQFPDDRTKARAYHGGDLKGIQEHLEYLKAMGVTAVWPTPFYDNHLSGAGSYHGYSASDMYGVDPHLGTLGELQRLVKALHAQGMKFVMDTVPNHVGPGHPWVMDPPMEGWLHGSKADHIETQYDFTSITNPQGDVAKRNPLLNGWFANSLPDLNQDNPLVTKYLVQNEIWWIEMTGLDGLRIDTFPYVPRSFWNVYDTTLHKLYPRLREVGEIENGDAKIVSFFAGGKAGVGSDGTFDTDLDTPFDYPMYYALTGALTHRKPMTAVADVLAQDGLYTHPERLVTFVGNHDQKRFLSLDGANVAALKLGYGLLATLRGTPELYYGDEIGMTGGDDPDNRRDFPGGFPGDARNAFTAAGRTPEQEEMHAWVTALFQLRKGSAALTAGKLRVLLADEKTLAVMRGPEASCAVDAKSERYVVVVNNDAAAQDVEVPVDAGCTQFRPALGGAAGVLDGGKLRVHLGGQEMELFRVGR